METRDEFLSQNIYSLIHELPSLGHCPIRVVCRDGVVFLRGKVDTPEHGVLAEALVSHLPGIRSVVNQLSLFEDGDGLGEPGDPLGPLAGYRR